LWANLGLSLSGRAVFLADRWHPVAFDVFVDCFGRYAAAAGYADGFDLAVGDELAHGALADRQASVLGVKNGRYTACCPRTRDRWWLLVAHRRLSSTARSIADSCCAQKERAATPTLRVLRVRGLADAGVMPRWAVGRPAARTPRLLLFDHFDTPGAARFDGRDAFHAGAPTRAARNGGSLVHGAGGDLPAVRSESNEQPLGGKIV
jgi:hypothetical protein